MYKSKKQKNTMKINNSSLTFVFFSYLNGVYPFFISKICQFN
jgi:hypothetical protein